MNSYVGMILVVVAFVLGAVVGYYFGTAQSNEEVLTPTATLDLFSPTATPRPLFTATPTPLLSPTLSPTLSPLLSPSPSPLTSPPRTSPSPTL